MLAWMDAEALAATLASGEVHFHSRSRDALWRKGETSGNMLRLVDLAIDCDGDALLVTVDPVGPTCHRGKRSCFDEPADGGASPPTPVAAHKVSRGSRRCGRLSRPGRPNGRRARTRALLDGGVDAVARKVTEEATEVLIAAKDDAAAGSAGADRTALRAALANETADLLYHTLVLLAERDCRPPTSSTRCEAGTADVRPGEPTAAKRHVRSSEGRLPPEHDAASVRSRVVPSLGSHSAASGSALRTTGPCACRCERHDAATSALPMGPKAPDAQDLLAGSHATGPPSPA